MRSYPGYRRGVGGSIIFALFLVGVILTVGLYFVKTRAQTAKTEASQLLRKVEAEQKAVKLLRAELAHLESPDRLSDLAERELGLLPVKSEQTISPEELVEMIPMRDLPDGGQP